MCVSRTDIRSSSVQGSIIHQEHWQHITQAENWMAVLIQQYPHFTQLIFIKPAKAEVCVLNCHVVTDNNCAAAVFFLDLNATSRKKTSKTSAAACVNRSTMLLLYILVCQ